VRKGGRKAAAAAADGKLYERVSLIPEDTMNLSVSSTGGTARGEGKRQTYQTEATPTMALLKSFCSSTPSVAYSIACNQKQHQTINISPPTAPSELDEQSHHVPGKHPAT
jgi:hypothetical protein